MCIPALLSPGLAMATGKLSPLTAISPALGIYKTLTKKKKPDEATTTPAATSPTYGASPSFGGG